MTAAEAYESTLDRQRDLEQQRYNVRVLWECDLYRNLKSDPEMAAFFKGIEMFDPLDPRTDAFFGGLLHFFCIF
jgi:G:T-mismatch repair DNA endonuclease (very short patch repair protein)